MFSCLQQRVTFGALGLVSIPAISLFLARESIHEVIAWIIERLDRKLADAIGSNIVGKCDITPRDIQLLTSDVLRIAYFISLSSTIQIAHALN